jgi:hypothetical protein
LRAQKERFTVKKSQIMLMQLPFLLLLTILVMGSTSAFNIRWWDQSTYSNSPANTLKQWAEGMEGRVGYNLGTGSIFYVDSGVSSEGDGSSWTAAKDTLEEAIALCTASQGDVIYVAQGHAETFITESLDVDKIGITIIGCGSGSLKPTITYNHANAEVAIGADNCSIYNIRFLSSITDVLMGIEVEDGVDYFHIEGCEFLVDTAGTDDFLEAINFVNNNTGCTIKNCVFNAGAGAANAAIMLDADTDTLSIIGNDIRGDYAVGCIAADTTASTDILIRGNLLCNGDLVGDGGLNAVAAIDLGTALATGGICMENTILSDVATGALMRIFDDGVHINNWIGDTDGDEYGGAIETTSASITVFVDGG